ncbi:MAG: L-histidine N(alpha)-methyltransferase [Phycisphaerae bacterium]
MKKGPTVQAAMDVSDDRPEAEAFRRDVIRGLTGPEKRISSKYLYDERGSKLFDDICELHAYYPTRTELAILRRHGREIADLIGPNCLLVEPGSGSSVKVNLLLEHLKQPAGYVPIDISMKHLARAAAAINQR